MNKNFPATPIRRFNPNSTVNQRKAPPLDESIVSLWGQCHLGKAKKRVCAVCKAHESSYECVQCEVSLCLIPCYDLHLLQNKQHKVRVVEKTLAYLINFILHRDFLLYVI